MEGPFRFGSNPPIPLRKGMRNPRIPMLPIHVIFLLLLQLLPLFSAASSPCNRTCSNSTEAVPYPFGFSDGCPIRLNCSGGQVQLGDFRVSNISSDALLIHVPPDCNRSIRDAYTFFGPNYAMTARTGLLLRNCSSSGLPECQISTQMLTGRFYNISVCGNVTCAPADQKGKVPLPVSYLDEISSCIYLYSSAVYTFGGDRTVLPSFEWSAVEMGWWLGGGCGVCAANAACVSVNVSGNGSHLGVRCVCQPGFVGDAFAGCRPEGNLKGDSFGAGKRKSSWGTILAIAILVGVALLLISVVCICFHRRKRKMKMPHGNAEEITFIESLLFTLPTLITATNNFSDTNKLGEGGFGSVYKGLLLDGREIAVKRLSAGSGQGIKELKNEVVLLAKLQHRNLVQLLGVCLEQEKLLVYEYVPNRSLDTFLFDPERREQLYWERRYKIIRRIAQGLQYLHEDSQVKIIHRDLKASNILLDAEMNPKISDFGLARLFGEDQTQAITSRVVGTYGYMAPEYAMRGHFSNKSDVFSFGVLVLEMITGRRNNSFFDSERSIDLLCYESDGEERFL